MTAMRLGFWPPVYGNWIMTDSPDQGAASYEYVKETTLLAEQLGFDTLLLAEHFIHPNGATLAGKRRPLQTRNSGGCWHYVTCKSRGQTRKW